MLSSMAAQHEDLTQHHKADLLLVTATEVEARAVLEVFPRYASTFRQYSFGENVYFDLGVIGGARIFMVQCEIGTCGLAGATLVVYDGIKDLSPSAVIMVGIAFGLIPDK